MQKHSHAPVGAAFALLVFCSLWPGGSHAQEVDLSCMHYQVRSKIQVAERYKEYDVVVENECQGPVYWSMCIERLDPLTQRIIETHTPGGYLENNKNSRVNLQMKKNNDSRTFRQRFQEFYVNVSYGIEGASGTRCVARACESQKRALRDQFRANLDAWQKATEGLEDELAAECPESGWGKTEEVEGCRAALRDAARPKLEQYEQRDAELRGQIVAGEPAYCRLHGGDLVPR